MLLRLINNKFLNRRFASTRRYTAIISQSNQGHISYDNIIKTSSLSFSPIHPIYRNYSSSHTRVSRPPHFPPSSTTTTTTTFFLFFSCEKWLQTRHRHRIHGSWAVRRSFVIIWASVYNNFKVIMMQQQSYTSWGHGHGAAVVIVRVVENGGWSRVRRDNCGC